MTQRDAYGRRLARRARRSPDPALFLLGAIDALRDVPDAGNGTGHVRTNLAWKEWTRHARHARRRDIHRAEDQRKAGMLWALRQPLARQDTRPAEEDMQELLLLAWATGRSRGERTDRTLRIIRHARMRTARMLLLAQTDDGH